MEAVINMLKQSIQNLNDFLNGKLLLLEETDIVKNLIVRLNMSESEISMMNNVCTYLADILLPIILIYLIYKFTHCVYKFFSKIFTPNKRMRRENSKYDYNNRRNNRKRKRRRKTKKAKHPKLRGRKKHFGFLSWIRSHGKRNSKSHRESGKEYGFDTKRNKSKIRNTDAYNTMEIPRIRMDNPRNISNTEFRYSNHEGPVVSKEEKHLSKENCQDNIVKTSNNAEETYATKVFSVSSLNREETTRKNFRK